MVTDCLLKKGTTIMQKNQILKIYGTDYFQMTKEILEESGLAEMIEHRKTELGKSNQELQIGIKPNLVSPSEASWGGTTHPEVVEGIIVYLQEQEFTRIAMLEGSWVGDKTQESIEVCGYDRLSKKYRVPFWDMQKDSSHTKDCAGLELQICDSVEKIDFLINVPVLKGHCQTKMTCALKNMKGLIPNKEKRHFHAMGLHKPIAHLSMGIHQDFIVVDNICGDLDFEDGGNPTVRNCIMTAADPVLMDACACHMLHYETEDIGYLKMAEELGCGSTDLEHADIRLCRRNADYTESELPKSYKVAALEDAVEEVESCSACYGYFLPALQHLKEEGLLEKLDTKVCIGQGYRGETGKLGVGSCTSGFEYSVKGCPPTEEQIYESLKKYISEK